MGDRTDPGETFGTSDRVALSCGRDNLIAGKMIRWRKAFGLFAI